jgi:hypothetical protein
MHRRMQKASARLLSISVPSSASLGSATCFPATGVWSLFVFFFAFVHVIRQHYPAKHDEWIFHYLVVFKMCYKLRSSRFAVFRIGLCEDEKGESHQNPKANHYRIISLESI